MAFSRLPLGRGGIVGAIVYAVGYAAVYLRFSGTAHQPLERTTVATAYEQTTAAALVADATLPTWKAVGWLFYGANGVPIQLPGTTGYLNANVLSATGPTAYVFTAIPVALFVAGGFWTYSTTRASVGVRSGQWKYAGVGMALGYVLLMVVGALLVSISVRGHPAGPNLLRAVYAGLAIPALSGAVGARLEMWVAE